MTTSAFSISTCAYCGSGRFGSATTNINEDRRVQTPAGPVHMRCLAYLIIDLGIERAFGKVTQQDKQVIVSRLNLPTPASDTPEGIVRYRQIAEVTADTGLSAPYVSYPTQRLVERLEKESAKIGHEKERIADVRAALELAEKALAELDL